ncbi:MAG: C40 family peptidase [Clostridia bacterium]|nr:C40 family peptidase [Clostridia bacterium]
MSVKKLCAAALALILMAAPAALAASVRVVTNADTRVYSKPSTGASAVSVSKGLSVSLKDSSDGWGKVSYKGKTAYVPLKYLDLADPVKAYLSWDATLYRNAGSGSAGTVPAGTAVYVLGVEGGYARVKGGGHTGYITKSALTSSKPAVKQNKAAEGSATERAIFIAKQLKGRPYSLVADAPNSFNCAAFVSYCYNHARSGSVKSSLNGQVHDSRHAKITSISALKRGDLVCFNFDSDDDRFGHVGIYLGDGRFIHASSSVGEVTVSSLSSGYYKRTFSWGRRIFSD